MSQKPFIEKGPLLSFCKSCGMQTNGITKAPGSVVMVVLLWLFLLPIGIIYSAIRFAKRAKVCPHCGGKDLIPVGTPEAQRIMRDMYSRK